VCQLEKKKKKSRNSRYVLKMEQRRSIKGDLNNDSNPQNQLSEYEKQIQQNIELKNQMFEEIVGNAKNELMKNVIPVFGENSKSSKRGSKRKTAERYILFICLEFMFLYFPHLIFHVHIGDLLKLLNHQRCLSDLVTKV